MEKTLKAKFNSEGACKDQRVASIQEGWGLESETLNQGLIYGGFSVSLNRDPCLWGDYYARWTFTKFVTCGFWGQKRSDMYAPSLIIGGWKVRAF